MLSYETFADPLVACETGYFNCLLLDYDDSRVLGICGWWLELLLLFIYIAIGTSFEAPLFLDRDYFYLSVSKEGRFFLCC